MLRSSFRYASCYYSSFLKKHYSSQCQLKGTTLVTSDSTNPYLNLAIEEWILRNSDPESRILYLYRNRPCIVIGRNQNPWKECNLEFANSNDVWVVRRISGGGAVYHDLGNTNYSVFMPRTSFDRVTSAALVSQALNSFNIPAIVNSRHDITVDDYKVSGSAFKIIGKKAFHHGTMLLNTDPSNLHNCLHSKMNISAAKGVDSVRSKVANLQKYSKTINHSTFSESVALKFKEKYGEFQSIINFDKNTDTSFLTSNDSSGSSLSNSKSSNVITTPEILISWDWLFGQTPEFIFEASGIIGDLNVQASVTVLRGYISSVSINSLSEAGKSLITSTNLADQVNSQLIGKKLDKADIQAVSKRTFFNPALSQTISIIYNSI